MTAGSSRIWRRGTLGNHRARVHGVHPVAQTHEHRHVVLDDQDRAVQVIADAAHEWSECFCFPLGNARRRLIEQQKPGLGRHLCGQIADPPHPRRELRSQRVGPRAEAEGLDDLERPPPAAPLR